MEGCAAVVLLCVVLESIHLGPLGRWGVHEGGIHVGPLGRYALRPYYPLPAYFEMIFMRGNFHLLGLIYLASLAVLTIRTPRASAVHWMMGGLVFLSQGIIFGLSSYSLYAEIGTAINRLLLHFLPVFILTSMAGFKSLGEVFVLDKQAHASHIKPLFTRTAATTAVLLSGIAAAVLIDSNLNSESNLGDLDAGEDLVPVLGNLKQVGEGRQQFTDTPGPVAVAKVLLKNPGAPQARYVVTDVQMTKPEAVSFYWITADNPQVQSYSLDVSGPRILDMKSVAAYSKLPVTEMGYLVAQQSLEDVQLGGLQVKSALLPEALPAVLNHWITPDVISQRSINVVDGHLPSPISWGAWQSATLTLIGLLALLFTVIGKYAVQQAAGSCIALAVALWLVSDVISLRQIMASAPQLGGDKVGTGNQMDGGTKEALAEIADAILSNGDAEAGMISIALDQSGEFQAKKLPLLLAPKAAVSLSLESATRRAKNWQGHFIVFSDDQDAIRSATEMLEAGNNTRLIKHGKNYVLLGPHNP
jgi:hypothetical protein